MTKVSATKRWIMQKFPSVENALEDMKIDGYQAVARTLQRIEAELVLVRAARSLIEQGVPVLTVHDELTVPETKRADAARALELAYGSVGLRALVR